MEKNVFKTTYKVEKMDCPNEEHLIRMGLKDLTNVKSIVSDIPKRILYVYHYDSPDEITERINNLNLEPRLITTEKFNDNAQTDVKSQKKVLIQVLIINLFFFSLEVITGLLANSMGLVADSLDMLADSIVYSLSLFAVRAPTSKKKLVAAVAGFFQMSLAILGFIEVIKRTIGYGDDPDFKIMIVISLLALIGNAICLYLLYKSKSEEAHMKASMIFTSNDVIANLGVIVAGIFVYLTESRMPDLLIGAIIFLIVARGAYRIIGLSR